MNHTGNVAAVLALEDGTVFHGRSIGAKGNTTGEVVFNTAMTGYQEILTDPSYCRQIVTLTYPHIGNTGTNPEDLEAASVYAAGLIIRDLPAVHSNWRASESLESFLQRGKIVAIADIDTRKLTRILREKGALAGCIMTGEKVDAQAAVHAARKFPGLKGMDLAKVVSTKRVYQWNEGTNWGEHQGPKSRPGQRVHVVAYDYGIKRNILRCLADQGARVTVVPAQTPADKVLAMNPDGIFLSNGPGDPEPCTYAIEAIKKFLETDIPVFGICLGHQLLGLASDAKTVKMKFGHHGANHPVQDMASGRVLISSQNHGFAVDESTLGPNVKVTHKSLFDGSLQGIERTDCPAFSFQGHPEAAPGPQDVGQLFTKFTTMIHQRLASAQSAQNPAAAKDGRRAAEG
ncbi:glutamine-hydrolyzing carbamoyl-phosphate synthase small subunit [Peristeroidobacter soli]|jgi:carbamoyl-phosphate synthase small subunit|uniref:glutamine-hydrolyzing carbamoyl-phosphate synthase small subunit n=1 Tax=Peristeroidobacter soli TaxID=2497877 RepID=UPI00101B9C2C